MFIIILKVHPKLYRSRTKSKGFRQAHNLHVTKMPYSITQKRRHGYSFFETPYSLLSLKYRSNHQAFLTIFGHILTPDFCKCCLNCLNI